jgi:methylmalonyl-CoA mutase
LYWAERGHTVTGLDLSDTFLAAAREAARQRGLNIDLRLQDIRHLEGFRDFDLVTWIEQSFFDEAMARAALDALEAGARADENLLALSVEAARARCSLGEISDALERAFGRYHTNPEPVRGIYGKRSDARWSEAVEGTQRVAERLGRQPRILVAKMGQDGHDRGANLVSSAFGDLGFEVIAGPLFQTPRETAEMAVEHDVDVVGASSLAAGHKTLIPELIAALKEAGRADIKVVAGGVIPPQDYAMLRKAGVQAIFGPGTNLADAADEVLRLLGHNKPPMDEAAE